MPSTANCTLRTPNVRMFTSTSTPDGGEIQTGSSCPDTACCAFDDLDLAVEGMSYNDVWVTRLRANLPVSALNVDLKLEAAPKQDVVSGFYTANQDPATTASIAPLRRDRMAGSATIVLGAETST